MLNEWKANDFYDHNSGKVATRDSDQTDLYSPGLVAVISVTVDSSFVSSYGLLSINNVFKIRKQSRGEEEEI